MNKQRVLITGASRGIGKAIATALLKQGFDITGTSRNPEKEKQEFLLLKLDLTNKQSILNCAAQAGEIDVLINNAGISQMGPVEEMPVEKIRELFETNFFGLIELTKQFLPQMRERKKGFIINIGSLAGKFAPPFKSSYTASKFALAGFSWSLRNEVMPFGIKVTVIEPADIDTSISPELFTKIGSAYAERLGRAKKTRDANMRNSPGPEVVAEKIIEVLRKYQGNDKQPDPFYAVGKGAALNVFAKRFFPDTFIEKQVRKSYGLD